MSSPARRRVLTGAEVTFPKVSVGATENLLMAACLAKGETVLINAAREPGDHRPRPLPDRHGCQDHGHRLQHPFASRASSGSAGRRIPWWPTVSRPAPMPWRRRSPAASSSCSAVKHDLIAAAASSLAQAASRSGRRSRGCMSAAPTGPLNGVDVMTEPYPGLPRPISKPMMRALMTTADGCLDDHRDDLRESFHARAGS